VSGKKRRPAGGTVGELVDLQVGEIAKSDGFFAAQE
jgi:hypothetical protein